MQHSEEAFPSLPDANSQMQTKFNSERYLTEQPGEITRLYALFLTSGTWSALNNKYPH